VTIRLKSKSFKISSSTLLTSSTDKELSMEAQVEFLKLWSLANLLPRISEPTKIFNKGREEEEVKFLVLNFGLFCWS